MYSHFAQYYDRLTRNVDYPARADYFCRLIERHFAGDGRLLLDLACGTGSLSFEFARRGWEVIGTDASADMLAVAAGKQPDFTGGKQPLFLRQRMERLNLFGTVDVCVCALDSLNHVASAAALARVFRRLALFIETGGLFVFDVNTPYKHERVLAGETFVYDEEDVYCVWQNAPGEAGTVEIRLDFFERAGGDTYRRTSECFCERAYTTEALQAAGARSGFALLGVYAADTFSPPKGDEERLVYVMENLTEHRAFAEEGK